MGDRQGFYPQLHVAPPLVTGKRPHWNDFQPAVWNKVTNQWNAWVLENEDIDTETGTAWRRLVSSDLRSWQTAEITIPKNTAGFGDAWTGQCFIDDTNAFGYGSGTWCFFLTMACPDKNGNQNQSVVLWTAPDGQTPPVCRGISLANPWGGNAHFRDPSVRLVNGKNVEMTITTGTGITIYQWDGAKWFRIQDIVAPFNTVECAQRFRMWSDDYGKEMDILVFSGNIYDRVTDSQTTVSMFSVLTPCASGYCMTSLASDVRKMVINGGADFYSFRLFSGLPDPCGFRKTKVYGMAWIGNWDYDSTVPVDDWMGQLSLTCEVTLKAGSGGWPVLSLNPLVPEWKRKFPVNTVTWVGDYSNIPTRQIPDVCEIEFTIKPDSSGNFPKKWEAQVYHGGFVGAKFGVDLTGDTGIVYANRDDYGLRPFGSFASWNYHPKMPIALNQEEYRVRMIKDKSSITWILNEEVAFTFLVLFPEGSPIFYVSIPEGSSAVGSCTISMNEFPSKNINGITNEDVTGRFLAIDTPVITTFDGSTGDPNIVNHAIKQIFMVTDAKGNFTGLRGTVDKFDTPAIDLEVDSIALRKEFVDFKKVAVTSPVSDATNSQVLQVFRNRETGYFSATVDGYDNSVSMEPELHDFEKIAVTSFGDTEDGGNRQIKQITWSVSGGGPRAVVNETNQQYVDDTNAGILDTSDKQTSHS